MSFKDHYKLTNGIFKNRSLIIDSGTSFIMIPRNDLVEFLEIFKGYTNMTCILGRIIPNCFCTDDQYSLIPDLQYTLDSKDYIVPKQSYINKYKNPKTGH